METEVNVQTNIGNQNVSRDTKNVTNNNLLQAHHPTGDIPIESIIDHDELTDIRAYQRTFDGAYTRTALGQLSYAILILRLFEREFYWCGLIYTILATQLVLIGVYRYNLAISNDDRWKDVSVQMVSNNNLENSSSHDSNLINRNGDRTQENFNNPLVAHTAHRSIFRPTFRTAGSVVATATIGTLILEIALIALVLKM